MNEKIYAVDTASKGSNAAGIWIDLESGMDAMEIEEAAKTALGCREVGYTEVRDIPKCLIEGGSLSELIGDYLSLDDDKKWIAMRLEQAGEADLSRIGKVIDDEYTEYNGWNEIFEEWHDDNGLSKNARQYIDTEMLKKDLRAGGDYTELGFRIDPNRTHHDGYPEDVIVEFHY